MVFTILVIVIVVIVLIVLPIADSLVPSWLCRQRMPRHVRT